MKHGLEKHNEREHHRHVSIELQPLDDWQMRVKVVGSLDGARKSYVCMNNEREISRVRHHLIRELSELRQSRVRVHH